MWKLLTTLTALTSLIMPFAEAGKSSAISEHSKTANNHPPAYHYPAPPRTQQFHDPKAKKFASSAIPIAAPATAQNFGQGGNVQTFQSHYHDNLRTASGITQQFTSPVLDNAAFKLALTNQGYKFTYTPPANAISKAKLRSNKLAATRKKLSSVLPAPSSAESLESLETEASLESVESSESSESASPLASPTFTSLNVKLPLPLGVTPLNIAPLPLQSGAPYTGIPNIVTSYGTPYPQRK